MDNSQTAGNSNNAAQRPEVSKPAPTTPAATNQPERIAPWAANAAAGNPSNAATAPDTSRPAPTIPVAINQSERTLPARNNAAAGSTNSEKATEVLKQAAAQATGTDQTAGADPSDKNNTTARGTEPAASPRVDLPEATSFPVPGAPIKTDGEDDKDDDERDASAPVPEDDTSKQILDQILASETALKKALARADKYLAAGNNFFAQLPHQAATNPKLALALEKLIRRHVTIERDRAAARFVLAYATRKVSR